MNVELSTASPICSELVEPVLVPAITLKLINLMPWGQSWQSVGNYYIPAIHVTIVYLSLYLSTTFPGQATSDLLAGCHPCTSLRSLFCFWAVSVAPCPSVSQVQVMFSPSLTCTMFSCGLKWVTGVVYTSQPHLTTRHSSPSKDSTLTIQAHPLSFLLSVIYQIY